MGMSDRKEKNDHIATSTSKLSDWSMEQHGKGQDGIMGVVNDFNTKTPYKPFEGQLVAGMSPAQQQAREYASSSVGSNAGLFDGMESLINEGASGSWNPTDVTSTNVAGPREVSYRTFDPTRVEARMNPYTRSVVDTSAAYMDEARDKEIAANAARATERGSYGGSRHGATDAEFRRLNAMDKASLNANLMHTGWNESVAGDERETQGIFGADTFNATGDYNARRDNAVRADDTSRFNVNRDDAATQFNIDNKYRGAGALNDLAGAKQNSWMKEVSMLEGLGASEREIEQAKLLAEKAQYDEGAAEQWKRMQLELQTRIGLFGSTPMLTDNTQTGSNTSVTRDPMGTIASLTGGMGGLFTGLGAL